MDLEFSSGQMDRDMKGSGETIKQMVKANYNMLMVTSMRANG